MKKNRLSRDLRWPVSGSLPVLLRFLTFLNSSWKSNVKYYLNVKYYFLTFENLKMKSQCQLPYIKLCWNPATPIHLWTVTAFILKGQNLGTKTACPQSRKYLLLGPLQKGFAGPSTEHLLCLCLTASPESQHSLLKLGLGGIYHDFLYL